MVDLGLVLVLQEVNGEFLYTADALESRVHVASVTKVRQPNLSSDFIATSPAASGHHTAGCWAGPTRIHGRIRFGSAGDAFGGDLLLVVRGKFATTRATFLLLQDESLVFEQREYFDG